MVHYDGYHSIAYEGTLCVEVNEYGLYFWAINDMW